MNKVLSIAKYTLIESSRQKIFSLSVFFAAFLLLISKAISFLTYINQAQVLFDFCFASVNVIAVLLTFYCGNILFMKEIGARNLMFSLSKPIGRWQFLIGKYLGYLVSVLSVVLINLVLLCLFLFYQGDLNWGHFFFASLGIFFDVLVSLAFVFVFTVISPSFLSLVLSGAYWLIANSHEGLKYLVETTGDTTVILTQWLVRLVSPNFALWNWKDNYLALDFDIRFFLGTLFLALLWSVVFLFVGHFVFRRKDCV